MGSARGEQLLSSRPCRRAELGNAEPAPRLTRESPGCRSRGFLICEGNHMSGFGGGRLRPNIG